MIHVLSEEESFHHLQASFAKLQPFDVIDIYLDTSRIPALVVSVNREAKSFDFLPMDRASAKAFFEGERPVAQVFVMPSHQGEKKSLWNNISRH